jgi:hypothetical protein
MQLLQNAAVPRLSQGAAHPLEWGRRACAGQIVRYRPNSIAEFAEVGHQGNRVAGSPLTRLAPDTVEAILDGRQPKGLRLAELLGNGPLGWSAQRATWGLSN